MTSLSSVSSRARSSCAARCRTGLSLAPHATWDARSRCFRAPALAYADLVRLLHRAGVAYETKRELTSNSSAGFTSYASHVPFQTEALQAWREAKGRGVVVLPTGAGKSHVAVLAIDDKRRSALVVAPTLDLVRQWYDLLRTSFAVTSGSWAAAPTSSSHSR